ncbi:MAG: hypothetical protein EOP86_12905 [Verrucomicrobiaceae bacterium]|nr:MAG: hypothetical protein EOP86_12905 [Verrucomicrobiaceae bacterium]
MLMQGVVTFTGEAWRWPAALALAAGAVLVFWSYRARLIRRRWWCAGLKVLGLALLALCVLEPQWSRQRVRPGANLFAVAADNSRSLQVQDNGAGAPRLEQLKQLLDPLSMEGKWQASLTGAFDVRRYLFDQRLQAVEGFSGLTADGGATVIGTALHTLADRFRSRPLAGVLLLTDGNATDMAAVPEEVSGWPPVYPVIIGGTGPARDLSVRKISVTQTAFEDAPVTVQADVGTTGFEGASLVARLTAPDGRVEEEQKQAVPAGGGQAVFRFELKAAPAGLSFHRFTVREEGESGPSTKEATLENNQQVLVVDRGQGPYRVLYVSGRPNWEYKFLNRALEGDQQVRMTALIRVARREPKFSFLGRAGETSNPLYRGTDDQNKETTAGYDQPVIVRLNTLDDQELATGFPKLPEELFRYHAVILDDVESEFFTRTQSALLQRFVSERGGGFLMLGGMETFGEGGYARTPVGDMLPVHLDRPDTTPGPGPVRFDLDREGWLQPWARLRANESDERSRIGDMPPLRVMNRIRDVKPGASVIAMALDAAGKKAPALVVQRFGRGRTAGLMIGDLWRWGMKSPESRTDLEKAWRQLVRWLVADVPGRVALAVEPKPNDASGTVDLQVRVRNADFQPVENAAVTVEVEPVVFAEPATAGGGTPPKTEGEPPPSKLVLQAEPSLEEPGLYTASYVPQGTGGWKATAKAVNADGAEEGRAVAGGAPELAAQEFRSLQPNTALLEELARRTGGRMVPASELEAFTAKLPQEKAPVMETWTEPLWHTPWIFLTAVGCLLAEWGLRRTQGLP